MAWRLEVLTHYRLADFINICEELWASTALGHLEFNRDECRRLGIDMITLPTHFCQLAIDDNENVIGCMAGYVMKLIFSGNYIGNEEGIYVKEGVKERASIAAEMLRRFVRFCRDCGAVDVRTGVISNIDNYAADVFYRRNGFKRIGTIYALRNPGGV